MIANWDSIVSSSAAMFESKYKDSNVFVFDTYDYLSNVLDNAAEHHFKNTTDFCPDSDAADIGWNYESYGCSPIYDYFWFSK